MRYVVAIAVLFSTPAPTFAQQATCTLQAIEKKLTGAALSQFVQKCTENAQTSCEQLALTRRLEEPNRTLFINACIKAFVG